MKKITKRFTFQCWNCQRTYTLFREITIGQQIIVACPYCNEEAVTLLQPVKKIKSVFRGDGGSDQDAEQEKDAAVNDVNEYLLPDIIPTQKPE